MIIKIYTYEYLIFVLWKFHTLFLLYLPLVGFNPLSSKPSIAGMRWRLQPLVQSLIAKLVWFSIQHVAKPDIYLIIVIFVWQYSQIGQRMQPDQTDRDIQKLMEVIYNKHPVHFIPPLFWILNLGGSRYYVINRPRPSSHQHRFRSHLSSASTTDGIDSFINGLKSLFHCYTSSY